MKRQSEAPEKTRACPPPEQARLRRLPRLQFVQWAVRALGGNWQREWERACGFQGQIVPEPSPRRASEADDEWYPVIAKQKDKVGRPDIDAFEAVMMREERKLGYFVSFEFTSDALFEIDRFQRQTGRTIKALTVREILDEEIAMKPE